MAEDPSGIWAEPGEGLRVACLDSSLHFQDIASNRLDGEMNSRKEPPSVIALLPAFLASVIVRWLGMCSGNAEILTQSKRGGASGQRPRP